MDKLKLNLAIIPWPGRKDVTTAPPTADARAAIEPPAMDDCMLHGALGQKANLVDDADVSFVLTSAGHNAGIVSEPGHQGRHFRFARRFDGDPDPAPDDCVASTPVRDRSWWSAWADWLKAADAGPTAPLAMDGVTRELLKRTPVPLLIAH